MSRDSAIHQVSGRGVPVRGNDIDTDRIIPGRYLKCVTFEGLGEHVFEDERIDADGRPTDHPFNDRRFQGAAILVSNRNFGCGSSREHAPQALFRWGIRGVVAESFAEIFFGNAVALGLPCVTAAPDDVERLMAAVAQDPAQDISVDLAALRVTFGAEPFGVGMPAGARSQLIEGTWDALGQLLGAMDAVRATADRLAYVTGW